MLTPQAQHILDLAFVSPSSLWDYKLLDISSSDHRPVVIRCENQFSIDLIPINFSDLFRFCPPSLVGAYYLHPPDARAISLHDDSLCNGTCSVTGGCITYWGGRAQTKRSNFSASSDQQCYIFFKI